jgi:monofunctional biosynthetic peptidoglycan transglycosylase
MSVRDWRLIQREALQVVPDARAPGRETSTAARLLRVFVQMVILLVLGSVVLTAIYGILPVPLTPLMVLRVGENLIQGKTIRIERDWVSLREMSPRLVPAMVAAEDMRFFEHDGFDWEAIEKALRHNERSRRIRGGSTISQQVAKNVFLWPARSWLRKSLEAWFTILIETLWSKERIMEVYLNVVELGDGVYGVEAASRRFFNKSSLNLSTREAALIAAVLPNPRRFLIARPSPYVRFRQGMIHRRMWTAAQTIPRVEAPASRGR